jgi:regulator of protease activity HflC (stomatin/prohibitin superfamily)
MDTRVVEIARIDRKKIILGTDIIFQENFNYRLRQDMVHKVFQILGSDYWSTVEKWIDSVIDGVTSRFTYAEIRADQEGFKQVLIKIVQSKVEERCREMTASLVTKEELVTLYELGIIYEEIVDPKNPTISVPDPDNPGAMIDKPNYIKVPKMIAVEEEGITEYVPAKGCIEVKKTLKGINFFELMTLTINDIKYPEDYQNARNNLVNKKIEAAIAKEEAKKMETLAEGRKKQLILEAEGTATAIRLKGEAENEV